MHIIQINASSIVLSITTSYSGMKFSYVNCFIVVLGDIVVSADIAGATDYVTLTVTI